MMIRYILLLISVLCTVLVYGQQSNIKMPIIEKNKSVTFEFYKAGDDNVKIEGSFTPSVNMVQRDSSWTYRIDSLSSEMYTYRFSVGKSKVLDPLNTNVVRDITDTLNFFIIDGFPGSYYKTQNVPHGRIMQLWYSSSFNEKFKQRRLSVYLPVGYERDHRLKYPVLYLLHGTGGDEMSWLDMGRLAQIMDNMIAQGKAKPMIVVMPNGNFGKQAAAGETAENLNYKPVMTKFLPHYKDGLYEMAFPEIVNYVDATFNTIADKQHRAIAGLSMGGMHTLMIAVNYPDMFNYIGLYSAGVDFTQINMEAIPAYANLDGKLSKLAQSNPKLFWIACGNADRLMPFNKQLMERMNKDGLKYTFHESSRGHLWCNWRQYSLLFIPQLFK